MKKILFLMILFMVSIVSAFNYDSFYNGELFIPTYSTATHETDASIKYLTQTFTIGTNGIRSDYTITGVKLKLQRVGTIGTINVNIMNTDANGKPTGTYLTSGTTNGNTLTSSGTFEWRTINLTSYVLNKDTKYAIVINSTLLDSSNQLLWNTESNIYGGYYYGEIGDSNDGSTWTMTSNYDNGFILIGSSSESLNENITLINMSGINYTNNAGDNYRAGLFESCTKLKNPIKSKLNITFNALYSHPTYNITPWATIRIRNIDNTLIEELNDTDRNNKVTTNYYYNPREYYFCFANTNSTDTFGYSIQSNLYGFLLNGSGTSSDKPYISLYGETNQTIRYLNMPYTSLTTNYNLNLSGYNNPNYPLNFSLLIDGNDIFNVTGNYIGVNNKTINLARFINNYYSQCSYIDSVCYIPIIFNSILNSTVRYDTLLFNNIGFLENSQSYNTNVYETMRENFMINISYDSNYYPTITAKLNYDGSEYSGIISSSGSNTIINSSILIPSVINSTNKSFYWNISLTNSSGTYYFQSNVYNQTVNPITISICNPIYNNTYINFTVYDAFNTNLKVNASFKSTFNIGRKNYSYQDLTETNKSFAFCLLPSSLNYTVSASIEYYSTGYNSNNYYLYNSILTNVTSNISIYLLNSSYGTLTQLKVYDDSQTNLENVIIQIQQYDIGTNTFYTVAMAKTDYNGEDLVYLNWYDTYYKFILSKDGNTILMTNTTKISESPKKFEIPTYTTFDFDKFEDITYSLTYNNLTSNFILTFAKTNGLVTSGCLKVIKRNIKNDTIICDSCESSSSATIYCNINDYGNGTFIATFYATGSQKVIDLISLVKVANEYYEKIGNTDGSMYAFLFTGITLSMFLLSPVFAIIGTILGMVGGMALGFQPLNYIEFIGLVIIGGLIIWILKR